MKKGFITVVFMVAITAVFISILASIHELTQERVEKNLQVQWARSFMYACNVFPSGHSVDMMSPASTTDQIQWDNQELFDLMEMGVNEINLAITDKDRTLLKGSFLSYSDSVKIYRINNEMGTGFAFLLKGKGLWGTISAIAVINSDLTEMLGIDFIEQVETPGLGARISEHEFKTFFRGLDISGLNGVSHLPGIIMVGKKTTSNLEKKSNSVQSITGATQTCNGVLNMLNTDLRFYLTLLKREFGGNIPLNQDISDARTKIY